MKLIQIVEQNKGKMVFMLFIQIWDLTHKIKRNFEYLVQETQYITGARPNDFKILLQANEVWNHEICQHLMISNKEVIEKIDWVCTFCHAQCLETETSPKKFHRVKKESG
jgi:hypothetical protein